VRNENGLEVTLFVLVTGIVQELNDEYALDSEGRIRLQPPIPITFTMSLGISQVECKKFSHSHSMLAAEQNGVNIVQNSTFLFVLCISVQNQSTLHKVHEIKTQ
jgi:hypothetical protein